MKAPGISFIAGLSLIAAMTVMAADVAPAPTIAPPAKQRDLLACADDARFWIAHVLKLPQGNSVQTMVAYRSQWSGAADWTILPPIPGRVVSIATSSGELLMVLENGQWEIAEETDIRDGPAAPQGDVMVAITNDQDSVWGIVRGYEQPLTPPGTQSSATATAPSTEPSTQPAELRLKLCHFVSGNWIDPQPLPDGIGDNPASISLAAVNQTPILAWRRSDGSVAVSRLVANHWTAPVLLKDEASAGDFKLLAINNRPVLWLGGRGAGEVRIGDDFSRKVPLNLPASPPANITAQTLVNAFGNLRWIAFVNDQQIEQDFSVASFPESFPPARMSVTEGARPAAIAISPWAFGDAMLVVLAVAMALRQRQAGVATAAVEPRRGKFNLAPLGARMIAGMVDLAPLIAVAAIIHPVGPASPLAGIDPRSLEKLLVLAAAAYLLHTFVAEIICGQSIGKMVFGLRVVDADGKLPRPTALVLRNLLRPIDVLLLSLVFVSPLRQRGGDMAAGTIVIAVENLGDSNE